MKHQCVCRREYQNLRVIKIKRHKRFGNSTLWNSQSMMLWWKHDWRVSSKMLFKRRSIFYELFFNSQFTIYAIAYMIISSVSASGVKEVDQPTYRGIFLWVNMTCYLWNVGDTSSTYTIMDKYAIGNFRIF